ncbi:MAG: hypothetical protein HY898_28625 [Deltaproteobacteria bacterium]|nr:hypothetical protein [Deltaproteobacteria bacterium]
MSPHNPSTFCALMVLVPLCALACDRSSRTNSAPIDAGSLASSASQTPSASVAAAPSEARSSNVEPPTAPVGDAWLVLQTVSSQSECGTGRLGVDVLVETRMDGDPKPQRRHAFCPPGKKDMFEMCKAFQKCSALTVDAGDPDKVVVQCDRETLVLQVTATGTRLTGSKVDLEVSPSRLRLKPTKSINRVALVDC